MSIRKNWFTNFTVCIFVIMMTSILCVSVYNHFYAVNNGIFYTCVVLGIILILFLVTNLVIKLLSLNENEYHTIYLMIETISVVAVFLFGLFLRISPEVVFAGYSAKFFDAAAMLQKNMQSGNTAALVANILSEKAIYGYGKITAFFFSFIGTKQEVMLVMNIIFQMLAIYFVYRIVRRTIGVVYAVFALIISICMPSQFFSCYTLNHEALYAAIFFGAVLLFLFLSSQYGLMKHKIPGILCYIILGILLGLLCFMEPVSILFLLIFCMLLFFSKKKRILLGFMVLFISCAVFIFLTMKMSNEIGKDYLTVLNAYLYSFSPFGELTQETGLVGIKEIIFSLANQLDDQSQSIFSNYTMLRYMDGLLLAPNFVAWIQLINQVMYIWMLLLSAVCGIYMLRSKRTEAIICVWLTFGAVIMILFDLNKTINAFYYVQLLIIMSTMYLYYAYHFYLKDDLKEELKDNLKRNEMIEIRKDKQITKAQDLQEDAVESPVMELKTEKTRFIENPLPVPPRHKQKRIDYLIEPSENEMDFDMQVPEDSDWDI